MKLDRQIGICRIVLLLLATAPAWAGGPRFIGSMQSYFPGQPMPFYTSSVTYATDPGTLSPYITHTQADAMVAAAAAVWNVPTAIVTLAQRGSLAEHVSSANTYFDGTSVIFPPDVQPSNYLNIPIAVLYDTDGSVTDLLLGSGASSPSGCRQNAVTNSVDSLGIDDKIDHAILVLNGRCLTSDPNSLAQMQYQTMRAFGRVLGLAWSQLNDNIFTGASQPNAQQLNHWPVMHPLDVVCGLYTYQCMTSPFTLRPDDLSALALVYPVTSSNLIPGKQVSNAAGAFVQGYTMFPGGQGMELLNMTVTLSGSNGWDTWQVASGIAGYTFEGDFGNPVSGPPKQQVPGVPFASPEQMYEMGNVPIAQPYSGMLVQPEAINPLYTGSYALGPYARPPISLGVASSTAISPFAQQGSEQQFFITMANESGNCSPGNDGTESQPEPANSTGWWSGLLCGVQHSSWLSVPIKANHSWTIESTALDENGAATYSKAQPVLGIWNVTDPTGTLPTVASQPVAMNSMALGVTQLRVPAAATDGTYRFVIADQFGGGRPDFVYNARVLYADTVQPAIVPSTGGPITITGMGFRQGNVVLINGVRASVQSWSATQIVATAPSQALVNAGAVAVDVEVLDASTGGTSDIGSALTYSAGVVTIGPPATITVLSGEGQSVKQGTALQPILLQVNDANGNAVPGTTVNLYQTVYAWEGPCSAEGPCASAPVLRTQQTTATSDTSGQLSVTPLTVPNQPQTIAIAASAGATSFISLQLTITP
jgi:hypothetical protein